MAERKSRLITIGGKDVTVKELRNRDLLDLLEAAGAGTKQGKAGEQKTDMATFRTMVKDYLPKCVDGLDLDGLLDLSPSETRALYDAVSEVNADFFGLARAVGLGEIIEGLRKMIVPAILSDFVRLLGDLSPEDTPKPGTTAGALPRSASKR